MMVDPSGPALVLVFANGIRESVLVHPHDGGDPYMLPFLKKGITYARTHYDSGDIVEVLLSEPDTRKVDEGNVLGLALNDRVRHLYYLSYRWDADAGRKTYHLSSLHLGSGRYACVRELPTTLDGIPEDAMRIV